MLTVFTWGRHICTRHSLRTILTSWSNVPYPPITCLLPDFHIGRGRGWWWGWSSSEGCQWSRFETTTFKLLQPWHHWIFLRRPKGDFSALYAATETAHFGQAVGTSPAIFVADYLPDLISWPVKCPPQFLKAHGAYICCQWKMRWSQNSDNLKSLIDYCRC